MLFNVATLLREPIGSQRRYTLAPEPPMHHGTVELIRTPNAILVRFEGDVLLEAICSRCLAPFAYPEQVSFEELFAQQVEVATGATLEAPDEPEAFLIALNHTIDITEAVRQYSEMAAVMQPLCRPDCPGICPECGQDLTIAACRCDRGPIDARWAALAALKRSSHG